MGYQGKKTGENSMFRTLHEGTLAEVEVMVIDCTKSKRPAWMSKEEYAALPKELILREVRAIVKEKCFRARRLDVVTTLLDAEAYPVKELAELY